MKNFYNNGSDVITIKIEDCTGRRIGQYRFNCEDTKAMMSIFNSIIDKYGINIKLVITDNKSLFEDDKNFKF